jgi:hypothetical protein
MTGSAIYLYGDQVNDHGPYFIYMNDSLVLQGNDRSGCGGGYAKECEKLSGLKYFAGSLPQGQHKMRMVNGGPAEGNRTYFGEWRSYCPCLSSRTCGILEMCADAYDRL